MPTHSGSARGTPDSPPDPPATPPVQTAVAVRSTGGGASYAVHFSNKIVETRKLETADTMLSDREGEGVVTQGDEDVWVGKAGVVRVANAADSDTAIEVALQGETFRVEPDGVLALRFVPGPAGPIKLPETVLGVPSDAAVAGGAVVAAVGAAEALGFISLS